MPPAYRTVILDCDSTLSAVEGIEELAGDRKAEIVRLTEAAMQGRVPLEQVYGHRLELIRPTRTLVERVARRYREAEVPGARDAIAQLQRHGVTVRVLSGGLLPAVQMFAQELGIAAEQVDAVGVRFSDDGAYAGFDERSPLAQSGGKRLFIERLRAALPRPIMLVGDGATDLEAKPAVDLFVAFGGVVRRDPVIRGADVVLGGPGLDLLVPLALGPDMYIPARS